MGQYLYNLGSGLQLQRKLWPFSGLKNKASIEFDLSLANSEGFLNPAHQEEADKLCELSISLIGAKQWICVSFCLAMENTHKYTHTCRLTDKPLDIFR